MKKRIPERKKYTIGVFVDTVRELIDTANIRLSSRGIKYTFSVTFNKGSAVISGDGFGYCSEGWSQQAIRRIRVSIWTKVDDLVHKSRS